MLRAREELAAGRTCNYLVSRAAEEPINGKMTGLARYCGEVTIFASQPVLLPQCILRRCIGCFDASEARRLSCAGSAEQFDGAVCSGSLFAGDINQDSHVR